MVVGRVEQGPTGRRAPDYLLLAGVALLLLASAGLMLGLVPVPL